MPPRLASETIRLSVVWRIRAASAAQKCWVASMPPTSVLLTARGLLFLGHGHRALGLLRGLLAILRRRLRTTLEALLEGVHDVDHLGALHLRVDSHDLLALDLRLDHLQD